MAIEQAIFRRSELLLGDDAMRSIAEKRVIIFGVGGVGSWCAESLVRSGIKQLTIVDSDRVCITNINRQLMATSKTVGQVKVDALKERLLSINPSAEITAIQQIFTDETAENFHLDTYDYIIDAIDSLKDKALLIMMATSLPTDRGDRAPTKFFSSMGAALKLDPTRINVSSNASIQTNCCRTKVITPPAVQNSACVLKQRQVLAIPRCLTMSGVRQRPRSTVPWLTSPPSSVLCWQDW